MVEGDNIVRAVIIRDLATYTAPKIHEHELDTLKPGDTTPTAPVERPYAHDFSRTNGVDGRYLRMPAVVYSRLLSALAVVELQDSASVARKVALDERAFEVRGPRGPCVRCDGRHVQL